MQSSTLRDRVEAWRELLDDCKRKPTKKRVHALRVVTLRIQAELEHELGELPHASHQAQAMLQFGKVAEKLRAVLAPVREFDVWIGKLQRLRASLTRTAGYVPRSTLKCIGEIERLEERLKKRRRSAAQKLATQIAKRSKDLIKAGDDIEELTSNRLQGGDSHAVDNILQQFVAVAADFPAFDEGNLHEFRKRIKKVRYLAEIHQSGHAACGLIAAQLKKAQAAIGEWHDWQVLAHSAHHGRHGKNLELRGLLESLAAERFEEAIATCHGTKARIAAMQSGTAQASNGFRRKPPVRSSHVPTASVRKSA